MIKNTSSAVLMALFSQKNSKSFKPTLHSKLDYEIGFLSQKYKIYQNILGEF